MDLLGDRLAAEQSLDDAESSVASGDYRRAAGFYTAAADVFRRISQTQRAATSYELAAEYWYLPDKYQSATAYSIAAELYGELGRIVKKRELYEMAGAFFEQIDSKAEAAHCFQFSAKACLEESALENAGEFYLRAAELMLGHSNREVKFALENYLNSAIAYASCGSERESRNAYSLFRSTIAEKGFDRKDTFYFDKMVKTLTDNGLDDFASDVYVQKMNLKVKTQKFGMSKVMLWLWGRASDYGENWVKWMVYTALTILLFAVFYFPNPDGHGRIELTMSTGFKYPVMENFLENFIKSVSFSVTVFSTLGFGDVTPANSLAQLVVIAEVLLGYAFLALFITLISRKLMRK